MVIAEAPDGMKYLQQHLDETENKEQPHVNSLRADLADSSLPHHNVNTSCAADEKKRTKWPQLYPS